MKNFLTKIAMMMLLSPLAIALPVGAATLPSWNTTGNYVVAFNYMSTDYSHDMSLTQDNSGNLTGNGGYPAGGAHAYTWVVTSGSVAGNVIDFYANYTAPADAVTPLTIMHATGTIALDGTMSGTWSDNYQGGNRTGTWSTTSGKAVLLSAEDFGVVDYNTGLGQLKGYTAGFGLTNATFAGVQSVVVKLYAGATLLQTNTATAKVGTDILGAQISSPFDISGTFNYLTDGYWTNVRETEYGQSVPATKVVATVTLADGRVVTAENTNLTGDPTTIYPLPVLTTVKVTIDKFIDGHMATITSASSSAFPMSATWNATNIGAGTGTYALDISGFNSPNAYEAVTAAMTSGASYTTNEVTGGTVVGDTCSTGQPYALVGYTTGDTLVQAQAATTSLVAPNFSNVTSDKVVIVWNKTCALVPTPQHISPANNSTLTTATWLKADWTDVTNPVGGITYIYQSSNSSLTNPDGSFVTPAYTSGVLGTSEISTIGTPAGIYYWHVKAKDANGNVSTWSNAWKVTIDNTPVVTGPTDKNQCKNGGWRNFSNPSFKNQGRCVSSVENQKDKHDRNEENNRNGRDSRNENDD